MVKICILYIRSILEFNSNVWFSSITQEEEDDLECVQKVACRIILNCEYENYSKSLAVLKLENLKIRRSRLGLTFAKKAVDNPKMKHHFSLNKNKEKIRNPEKFNVKFAHTSRLFNSTIPTVLRMLNDEHKKKKI